MITRRGGKSADLEDVGTPSRVLGSGRTFNLEWYSIFGHGIRHSRIFCTTILDVRVLHVAIMYSQ